MMPTRARTVVFWGPYDTTKPRVRLLLDGARAAGFRVVEVNADVWRDVRDKSQLGAAGWLRAGLRMTAALPMLMLRYLRAPAHDWVVAPYPALPFALVVWPLVRLRGARVAWDVFISAWDTVVRDRRLLGAGHPLAMMLYAGEYTAALLLDRPFLDTAAHARLFERLYRRPTGSVGSVWVGVEEGAIAGAEPAPAAAVPDGVMRVLFYGQFSPLHGVEVVVEAARRVAAVVDDVSWLIVGVGQTSSAVDEALARKPIPRVERRPWVAYEELGTLIARADVCLGVFGTSGKALAVIPNKVFQVLSAGGRIVTSDGEGVRELLRHAPEVTPQVTTVAPGSAEALAEAVLSLRSRWRTGALPPVEPWSLSSAEVGRQLEALLEGGG